MLETHILIFLPGHSRTCHCSQNGHQQVVLWRWPVVGRGPPVVGRGPLVGEQGPPVGDLTLGVWFRWPGQHRSGSWGLKFAVPSTYNLKVKHKTQTGGHWCQTRGRQVLTPMTPCLLHQTIKLLKSQNITVTLSLSFKILTFILSIWQKKFYLWRFDNNYLTKVNVKFPETVAKRSGSPRLSHSEQDIAISKGGWRYELTGVTPLTHITSNYTHAGIFKMLHRWMTNALKDPSFEPTRKEAVGYTKLKYETGLDKKRYALGGNFSKEFSFEVLVV